MLTLLGFSMIVVFMYLIMSKRLSAFSALTVVPIVFALFGGFTDLGPMMMKGLETIAPTAIMIIFAILYFGRNDPNWTTGSLWIYHFNRGM
jgi:CitMHS family citrate-Mg2+:H+ or citrate-Ca2+:H+ symporter